MKIAYIDIDTYGRKYVREIIPYTDFQTAEKIYSDKFLEKCIGVSDNVECNMIQNVDGMFSPYWIPENTHEKQEEPSEIEKILDAIIQ